MDTAQDVLKVVELLEKALLNLAIIDLIACKRVCKLWNKCMQESPRLQQKLFQQEFFAAEIPRIRRHLIHSVQPVFLNPLLQNVFRIRHSEISGSSIVVVPEKNRRRFRQIKVFENVLKKSTGTNALEDPFATPIILDCNKFYEPEISLVERHRKENYWLHLPNYGERHRSISGPSYVMGAWASMLATQPAVRSLRLRCDAMGPLTGGIKVDAANREGVTLGELAGAAAEFYRRHEHRRQHGFGLDAEMSIYQPIEGKISRTNSFFPNAGGTCDDADGFQRAWKTKLRCNLG